MSESRIAASPAGQFAWALYDWANSAFFAVIGTFIFATYFTQAIAPDPETGTALWGYALTTSAVIIAIASPLLGAIADAGGRRKPWLFACTLLGVIGSAGLWTATPDTSAIWHTLVLFALANVGLEVAAVFYNAMLPDVVPPHRMGRMSGWAWGMGYAGGMVCLLIALFGFVQVETPPFGLDKASAENVRIIGPMIALWLTVFSIPLFLLTPDRPSASLPKAVAVRQGVAALKRTILGVRHYRQALLYLVAHMLYADGLATLFAFGGIYAAGTFGMELNEVIIFGIVLNVTAGIGAFAFAWVDDWFGPKKTIIIALVSLLACGLAALLVESKAAFWVAGSCLGIFVGPAQAASRSLMARLAPADLRAEMFGLYALSGKATAFLGPLLLGTATLAFASQRAGMATILAFFAIGLVLLLFVKEPPAEAAKIADRPITA
ncbi:MFS transporter [Marinivivus vitaminiproducens]|uniref:MFS transporter n=1 Tax=Marinivivus vitaminiproducens TaxID=3035935 RepID=UPI00279D8520|nr:MFS transporter [Geminicoccaceae bacterium SCSIO 64248]